MFLSLLVLSGGACYIGVKAYHILRGLPPLRQELAHPNSPSEPAGEEAEEMEQLNRRLVISSLTVGLAAGGAILFPPLGMAAAPPLLYLSLPTVQQLQRAWRRKEQQGNALFDLVLVTASLASGQPLAAALHFWLRSLSQRRLQRLRRAARQQWLAATLPDEGWVQRQGVRTKTPLHTIVASEILIVQAGELIAVDGVIDQGMALVDEHDLTQRLEPAVKEVCDRVFARTLTLAGELYVKVGKVGPETTAAYLDRTWQTATATQSALQCQGERLTAELTLPLLGLGALAAIGLGPLSAAALVNARPGYDTATVAAAQALRYLNLARSAGLVVKDSRSFETVAQVETVIFDFALAPRADFRETLIGLRQRNNCAIFLLADHPVPGAAHLADKLGVDGVWGVSSPAECVKLVRQWQQAGKMVCYIGTGGADGELLTCADLSISLRPLVALADDPAQVQLIQDCLPQVLRLFDLGQQFALMRRRAVGLTFWPGALSMGGTLLLGVGLLPAVLLNNVGLMVGVEDLTALWGSPQPLAKSQSHDWWQGWSNCVWPRAGNPLAVA